MFGIVLLFSTSMIAPAQSQKVQCPGLVINVASPAKGKGKFVSAIGGGDPAIKPKYKWAVSSGTITGGQGTEAIEVDAEPGASVTATLDVGGYRKECKTSAKETLAISALDPVKCPDLLMGKNDAVAGRVTFAAKTDPLVEGITWNWSVSAGSIASGQGTNQVAVLADSATSVTATVTVGGLPAGCSLSGSKTVTVK